MTRFAYHTEGVALGLGNAQRQILGHIALGLEPARIVGILGESGSGKSTLLRDINGQHRLFAGINDGHATRVRVGFQKQFDTLIEFRTILDNIIAFVSSLAPAEEAANRRAHDVLERAGLAERVDAYPNELSGGMRQRVQLAQVLVLEPDLLLLDEPFSQLDLRTQELMEDWVLEVVRGRKCRSVLVSHDLVSLAATCDEVHILGGDPASIAGTVEFDSTWQQLSPAQRRSSPRFEGVMSELWELRKIPFEGLL